MIIFASHGLGFNATEFSKISDFYQLEEERMKTNDTSRYWSLKSNQQTKTIGILHDFNICCLPSFYLMYPETQKTSYALILREVERKIHLK